jgi:hypothetical protein
MTHYITLVLFPRELGKKSLFSSQKPKDVINEVVMDLIYPYATYFPGFDYPVPCYCVPGAVQTSAVELANHEVGEFWELYKDYLEIPEKSRVEWSDYDPFLRWVRTCNEAVKQNPQFQEKKPDCDTCSGTGFMTINENYSRSEYDYFNIADLDSAVDPKMDPEYFIEVIRIPDLDIDFEAIVTPDGEWHELDWGAGSSDPVGEWEAKSKSILAQYPDHLAFKAHMHR